MCYDKRVKRIAPAFVLVALLASLLLNGYFLTRPKMKPPKAPEAPTVVNVIDGDTFTLNTGERVRLLGVNAPEMGRCDSEEAKAALSNLVLNKPVTIREEKRDTYGRRMGLVYVGDFLVNTEMIALGMAKPDYTNNSEKDDFITAYNDAKAKSLGVNSETCKKTNTATPPDPKCTIKGNIDKATGDKFYHLPSCPHYSQIVLDLDSGENYFCTEEQAHEAGFVKAGECSK